MAAVLAGTSHAPITALLLAFEMTRDYAVILPVMLGVAVSTVVARALRRDSIYTRKLRARGIDLDRREDLILRGVSVGELMLPDPPAVRLDAPLDVVLARFLESDVAVVFVVDADGRPRGQVSIHEVKTAVGSQAELGGLVVARDLSEAVSLAPRELTAADALERLSRDARDVLGVVDGAGRLVGSLPLTRVMDVVARGALAGDYVGVAEGAGPERGEAVRLGGGVTLRSVEVPERHAGKTLRQLEVRTLFGVSVIALRRGGVDQGVDPDRPLARGDTLVAMGEPADLARFESAMR
jgi:CIC family chloride channel protein